MPQFLAVRSMFFSYFPPTSKFETYLEQNFHLDFFYKSTKGRQRWRTFSRNWKLEKIISETSWNAWILLKALMELAVGSMWRNTGFVHVWFLFFYLERPPTRLLRSDPDIEIWIAYFPIITCKMPKGVVSIRPREFFHYSHNAKHILSWIWH